MNAQTEKANASAVPASALPFFVALMAFVIATMAWAFYSDPQEAPPLPLLIVLFGIPVGCIVGTLKVLLERIEEIGKGEEDAYRNY